MRVKLGQIAGSRSGDKGKHSNVGIYFYDKKVYDWAKNVITKKIIKTHFSEIVLGNVERYELDNILALNFILKDSLGGGGMASLNIDPPRKETKLIGRADKNL